MPTINPRIRFIEKFLAHFNSVFSAQHQKSIFREFIHALFSDYKRMSLAAIAGNTALNYQKFQYFFSEANWDAQELNDIRIRLLQNQKTTRAHNKGVLQNGCLSKIFNQPLQSIGECKQAVASLIIIDFSFLLSKNKDLAASLFNIKSERFKEKLKN